jgi:sugar phosphate isomerase/epimerase
LFRLGYNTNGLAHHRVLDGLRLLADLGYEAVALTPDAGGLDPLAPDPRLLGDIRRWSDELGLGLAVETGARFVLDPRRKHFPTLLEDEPADRARRVDFLRRSVEIASELGAGLVSVWAGKAPGGIAGGKVVPGSAGRVEELWQRLCDGLKPVLALGRERGVQIAFEPEPGMFVERPAGYLELLDRLGSDGDELGLTLDVGHLLCTGDVPVGAKIRALAPRLVHVHLDDVAGGVHEHRMFGEGDLDLPETLEALLSIGYGGMAAVELSRDSHRGAWAAEEALRRLRVALGNVSGTRPRGSLPR